MCESVQTPTMFIKVDCENCTAKSQDGNIIPCLTLTEKYYCCKCIEMTSNEEINYTTACIINYFDDEGIYMLNEVSVVNDIYDVLTRLKHKHEIEEICNCCKEKGDNMTKLKYIKLENIKLCRECVNYYPDSKVILNIYGAKICHKNLEFVNEISKIF